jgi:aspartyl protease family protein
MIRTHAILTVLAATLIAGSASATEVNVIGLFPGKAVVVVNGGKPRTLKMGDATPEGVKLVSVESETAVLEVDGKRRTLAMGQSISIASPVAESRGQATLSADSRGHFLTTGQVNGQSVRFLVDTGASMISLSAPEARRIGVNYLKGERGFATTANGVATVYKVKLDTVRVGEISLTNVDALVLNGDGLSVVLLGMSFLNRVEMRRDGQTMTLIKRF